MPHDGIATLEDRLDRISSQLENKSVLERVTELVESRLVDCGWKDQIKLTLRKMLEEDKEHTWTVDELIQVVTPKARGMVPDTVKRELLHELEKIFTRIDDLHYNKSLLNKIKDWYENSLQVLWQVYLKN
ncbi:enhancer of yellow 2 transcription factor [Agrilus planipennis]|uniref:Enhancer of yellow 2 transcription factor n=1 Tax=Agrilus planipennis TaxID=224129 RepID=A0A1W4XC38_AGRPL|nr:enhancer of yellow 2 transcription factor [Agrilus planipennis]